MPRTIPHSENGTSYHCLRAITSGLACARVSGHDREDDLERQKQVPERYGAKHGRRLQGRMCEVSVAPGSGMNCHRKGLKRLFPAISDRQAGRPVITHQDRLLGLGAEPVFTLCEARNVQVVILNQGDGTGFEGNLARDVLEIGTVFSARRYGSRSRRNQELPDGFEVVVEAAPC